MRIDSDGNVGIGTSSPSSYPVAPNLVVDAGGSGGITIKTGSSNYGGVYFADGTTGDEQYRGAIQYSHDFSGVTDSMQFSTAGTEAMRIDSSGNVGIGTSTLTSNVIIKEVAVKSSATNGISSYTLTTSDNSLGGCVALSSYLDENALIFGVQPGFTEGSSSLPTERMRIDSSGNVNIGATGTAGVIVLNRSSDGNGAGALSVVGDDFVLNTGFSSANMIFKAVTSEAMRIDTNGNLLVGATATINAEKLNVNGNAVTYVIHPAVDNVFDVGHPSYRWDDIRATNGTIQTSDRNDKQDIEELNTAEAAVAVACKGLLRKFRWKDSVAEKGDEARTHFGIIAQDLQAAFAAEGLDAGDYAMFISDTWWETQTEVEAVEAVEFVEAVEAVYDEDGEIVSDAVEGVEAVEAKDAYTRTDTFDTLADAPEGATERTRLGVRYPELLAFIIAAI
jgi:hypothetical protein